MKQRIVLFIAAVTLLWACGNNDQQNNNTSSGGTTTPSATPAKQAFINNCLQCHSLTKDKTGPKLVGVLQRWNNDTTQLVAFIKNSQQVVKDGKSQRAVKVCNDWNEAVMPPFPSLTDGDVKDLINYINKGEE